MTGERRFTSPGCLLFDGPSFAKLEPKGTVSAKDIGRAIVLHELGHLVGLGHVEDPTQVMYPSSSYEVTSLATGDLNGLAKLEATASQRYSGRKSPEYGLPAWGTSTVTARSSAVAATEHAGKHTRAE